jgi:hypothetical protein
MTAFFDLFVSHSTSEGWGDPVVADRRFPEIVAASPFRLGRPGDPIPERGARYLIGVATWSGYDMRLLDVLVEAISRHPVDPPAIDVFNTTDFPDAEDFTAYIPGLGEVIQTPVMGFWNNGQLVCSLQGHAAREFISGIFGFLSAEIVAFVQDWIKARAHA